MVVTLTLSAQTPNPAMTVPVLQDIQETATHVTMSTNVTRKTADVPRTVTILSVHITVPVMPDTH